VRNLRQRSILDHNCTPNFQSLSTKGLVKAVKRLVTGPQAWHVGSTPTVSKKIIIHDAEIRGRTIDWQKRHKAKLLPSGRYILFKNWPTIECWDVAGDRLIWTHAPAFNGALVLDFAVEETEEGDSLIIMLCVRTHPHVGDPKK
jgi:hypothetical protein